MKSLPLSFLSFLLLTTFLLGVSCEEKDPCEDGSPCNRETVKEIKDTIGVVRYDDVRQEFQIIFTPQGTYDSQFVTIPCSLEEEFKQEGTKVKVTGEFKSVCDEIKPAFGGQEYYYLKIKDISVSKD